MGKNKIVQPAPKAFAAAPSSSASASGWPCGNDAFVAGQGGAQDIRVGDDQSRLPLEQQVWNRLTAPEQPAQPDHTGPWEQGTPHHAGEEWQWQAEPARRSGEEEQDEEWRWRGDWQWGARSRKPAKAQSGANANREWENREHQELMQRAAAEGVLEAVEFENDGLWYVEAAPGQWKKVDYPYWCKHCEASLSISVISNHLNGERHRKRLAQTAWHEAVANNNNNTNNINNNSNNSNNNNTAAASGSGSSPSQPGNLEPWQERDDTGCLRCKACYKMCDGVHEYTAEHNRRVETFLWELKAGTQEYPEPSQPWLAWVADSTYGKGRYLKCLLCSKWINDLECATTVGYDGTHGEIGEYNQKDHARKLINLQYYLEDVLAEKAQWHPPQPLSRGVCPPCPGAGASFASHSAQWADSWAAPQAAAPAVTASAAGPMRGGSGADTYNDSAGSRANASQKSGADASGPPLPDGWNFAWDEGSRQYYYYKGKHVQWERPEVSPSPPSPPPPWPVHNAPSGGTHV